MQKNLEKPKLKHNKKRNTAFLFEALVKELTKAVLHSKRDKQKLISSIIKEHFNKNSVLGKELALYKQIYETKKFPKEHADRLLLEVKNEYAMFYKSKIFEEQSKLIAKINKMLGIDVYNNFVPNYKTLATISQIFNKEVEPRVKVLLEQEIIDYITAPQPDTKKTIEPIDSLTYKKFVDRFNQAYSTNLLPEQKQLLSRYINSDEESIDLKVFLNEEFKRLQDELNNIKKSDIIKENSEMKEKVEKLYNSLNNLKVEMINEDLIKKTMLIQEFVNEVKK